METEMVVCNIYKLFRNGNSFTKEGKVLHRTNLATLRSYAEQRNASWKTLGYFYEFDEDKTNLFYEKREAERLLKIKNSEISKKVASNLVNMLDLGNDVVEQPKVKAKKEPKIEEIDVVDEEIIEDKIKITGNGNLRVAYLDKFGKECPINKKNDDEWILAKLNDR